VPGRGGTGARSAAGIGTLVPLVEDVWLCRARSVGRS
jgi:hypothetical protein